MDHYLLIDGLNLAYRCFFAVPELTNAQGIAVNALQGWVRALWSLEDRLHPQVTIVFFDQGISTQRRAILESYKANRPPMPEALQQQLSSLKKLSQYMGYHIHFQEGIEADDLIASAARHYRSSGHSIFIADQREIINNLFRINSPMLLYSCRIEGLPGSRWLMGWPQQCHLISNTLS